MKDDEDEEIVIGPELTLAPMEEGTEAEFLAALAASGMRLGVCRRCTRSWLTRGTEEECPPCAVGKPDGWNLAYTRRKELLGIAVAVPTMLPCSVCAGVGVVGWRPYGKAEPWCSACDGTGQVQP